MNPARRRGTNAKHPERLTASLTAAFGLSPQRAADALTLPVALLAGGMATRLYPLTEKVPKSLLDVNGEPFVVHQIRLLRAHGCRRIVLCVGNLADQIQAALGDGRRWDVTLEYQADGDTLLGTGGALRKAAARLGEAFLVMYGDSYLECDYAAIERSFLGSGKPGLMTVFRNDGQYDQSNVLFKSGRIVRYDKQEPSPRMRHIDYGLGALRAEVLEKYPADTKFDLADVYRDLASAGDLAAVEVRQRFYEIGSPRGLEETRRYLATRRAS